MVKYLGRYHLEMLIKYIGFQTFHNIANFFEPPSPFRTYACACVKGTPLSILNFWIISFHFRSTLADLDQEYMLGFIYQKWKFNYC